MGKIIGALLGFFYAGFFGLFIGFFIGSLFDLYFENIKNQNFFDETIFESDKVLVNNFPVLLAYVTKSGNFDKNSVLSVKYTLIKYFGKENARIMMSNYKYFIENKFDINKLNLAANNLLYTFNYNSRIFLVTILYEIINLKGNPTNNEINSLKYIATLLNVSISDFTYTGFYDDFKEQENNYNKYNYTEPVKEEDPYKILEISKDASNDEIKKQYRTLCKKYHPDKTSHLPEFERKQAEEKIKKIIDAYEEIKKIRDIK